jgi:hypothetical protein
MGIMSLMKLAGGLGPEQLVELLSMAGIKAEFGIVEPGSVPEAFQRAAKIAIAPGSRVFSIHGKEGKGGKIEALLIMEP